MNVTENFSQDEKIRYSRHFTLPEFGPGGQDRLRKSRVLVIGAGGLGAPVLYYLTAAGVGKIGIADHDVVNISNLQRQILFTTADVGANKACAAKARLLSLNPHVAIEAFTKKVDRTNALEIIAGFDIVVDATDNFPTRYLLNDVCVLSDKPLVYGSVFRYEGQVAVFNVDGGPNYRDLYPLPPAPGSVPDCEQGGVLGVLPGVIGCIQANEVIKLIVNAKDTLAGRLLLVDLQTMAFDVVAIPNQNQRQKITNLIDYDEFCSLVSKNKSQAMKEVTAIQLKAMMDAKEDFQLIDCREPHEADICEIGGELIPQAEIPQNVARISKDKKVVIHCRSGARSGRMVDWLEKNHGFTNLYNLKGGILAWADDVDPNVEKY